MFHKLPFKLSLVTVSSDLNSCKRNLALAEIYPFVKPAFGFHPEQVLPNDHDISDLFSWIKIHTEQMAAIGEVGLPYYLRPKGSKIPGGYIELLEEFIKLAKNRISPSSSMQFMMMHRLCAIYWKSIRLKRLISTGLKVTLQQQAG